MRLILEGERPSSWNAMYAGQHWSRRKAEADRVHALIRFSQQLWDTTEAEWQKNPPTAKTVAVTVTAYFKNRPYDCCNIPAKLYIDGLKGWLFVDDSPQYVKSVTTRSEVDKDNPRVEIEVTEV